MSPAFWGCANDMLKSHDVRNSGENSMTHNNTHRHANPPTISRRGALHAGLLGIGGMSLATLLRQRAADQRIVRRVG